MKKYTHEKAHEEIDYIFKTLLPQRGMAERPEQIRLCHSILDAMLDGSIALCDAGTGIGKTFAYLTAGILHGKCRAAEGKPQRPTAVSWTPARAGSTRFRSATTTSCWRTSSTAAKRKSPSCRTARPSS